MNKKAIAILGVIFVLIVATLGFIIYQRSADNSEPETPTVVETPPIVETPIETPPIIEEPETPTTRAVRLTDESVVSPNLLYRGDGLSYFNNLGQLFQTNFSISGDTVLLSNKRELSIPQKPNISKILWPQAGVSYIAEFQSGGKKSWSFYDSAKADYVDLPPQVFSLDWLPSGDRIMFIWVDEQNKATLNVSNPDSTNYQTIAEMYEPDNVIKVSPDGQSVLFHRTQGPDQNLNPIIYVSADGQNFRTIIRDGYNQGVMWSADSQKFVFLRRNPSTGLFGVWYSELTNSVIKSLGVESTEDKILWSRDNQTVYVAGKSSQGSGEVLYKINTQTLEKTELDPGTMVDFQSLFMNTSESVIFFRNGTDQALYYMML